MRWLNRASMQSGCIVMRRHGLLLERRPRQVSSTRRHDGKVAVDRSNVRWCSDGFEFRCDDGAPLRVVFALDCCDHLGPLLEISPCVHT